MIDVDGLPPNYGDTTGPVPKSEMAVVATGVLILRGIALLQDP